MFLKDQEMRVCQRGGHREVCLMGHRRASHTFSLREIGSRWRVSSGECQGITLLKIYLGYLC